MDWIIIAVVIAVVLLLLVGLLLFARNRKQQQARERAGELRTEAARTAAVQPEQGAKVREAESAAAQAKAQAERLEHEARKERTDYDMTRAKQEDAVREADRLDPDVNHRSADYTPTDPVAPTAQTHDAAADEAHTRTDHGTHDGTTQHAAPAPGHDQPVPSHPTEEGHGTSATEQPAVKPTDPHDPDFDTGSGSAGDTPPPAGPPRQV